LSERKLTYYKEKHWSLVVVNKQIDPEANTEETKDVSMPREQMKNRSTTKKYVINSFKL
jgi:hypothetical protein